MQSYRDTPNAKCKDSAMLPFRSYLEYIWETHCPISECIDLDACLRIFDSKINYTENHVLYSSYDLLLIVPQYATVISKLLLNADYPCYCKLCNSYV